MGPPAENMVGRDWAFRLAANWRVFSGARFDCKALPDRAVHLRFTCHRPISPHAQPVKSEALKTTPVLLEQAAALPETEEVDMILAPAPGTDQELVEDLVLDDDRTLIQPGDSVLLIVEDDPTFARILVDLAHEHGLKALVALRGSSAMFLAREFQPGAITLDIALPDMAGWTILDRLKHDPTTRHIPIHVISGDENRRRGIALGAMTYLEKGVVGDSLSGAFAMIEHSVRNRVKKLLLISGLAESDSLQKDLGAADVEIIPASSGADALAYLRDSVVDGIVIDSEAKDAETMALVAEIQSVVGVVVPPIILLSSRDLTSREEILLREANRSGVVRRVKTREQALDESVLLLHRPESELRDDQCKSSRSCVKRT